MTQTWSNLKKINSSVTGYGNLQYLVGGFLGFERKKKNWSNRTFTSQNISASALLKKAEIVQMTSVKRFGLRFPECSWSWHVYMFLKSHNPSFWY